MTLELTYQNTRIFVSLTEPGGLPAGQNLTTMLSALACTMVSEN